MANNVIQIKRSSSTATPSSLNAGELAYSNTSKVLFVGSTDGGTVVPIGGERNPGTLTANQALVANATSGIDKIITGNAVITTLWANGAAGSSGQVLVSNGSAVYWGTGTSGANTQVQFNDSGVANGVAGFTFDKTSNTLTVGSATVNSTNFSGTANNSTNFGGNSLATVQGWITSNAATAYTNATSYADTKAATAYSNATSYADTKAATAYSNATSYADTKAATAYSNATSYADTKAGTAYSNAMSDTLSRNGSYTGNNTFGGTNTVFSSNVIVSARVSSNLIPASNNTYHLGNNDIRWAQIHTANVHAVTGTFDGDVNITGNLNVAGNVVTTNVQSVIVSDPMIYLAGNNYTSDLVDIGFAANYYDGSQRHTGLFRDHVDGVWKLFYNLTQELSGNNDVDTGDASYRIATLQTYLASGGLTTNSTSANLIANSTYSVGIVANNLTLSTALAGTSGGTGKSTMTNNAILVGNSSNGFKELTLGTLGYVLQSNGTALVYDVLDGGSF